MAFYCEHIWDSECLTHVLATQKSKTDQVIDSLQMIIADQTAVSN